MRRAILTGLVLCGFGVVLSGCAESDSGGLPSSAESTIRRGNIGEPETLDPLLAEDVHAFSVLIDLYEGLVAENASGQIIPGVAESWTVDEGGLVYTFSLRSDARWSNGDLVTAHDFVRALRRAAKPNSQSAYATLLDPIANFREVSSGAKAHEELGVVAVDERTLVIQLHDQCAYLLSLLAMPIAFPLHSDASSPAQFEDPEEFVGNGAYTLSQRRIGSPIRLQRNEQYWDSDAVKTEYIEYIAIVDELTEFNMYRAGELDVSGTIPSNYVRQARADYEDEVRIAPSLAFYYLAFDLTEAPLDDRNLRQALSMAIDRVQLTEILGRGDQPAYAIVPPGVTNYASAQYDWSASDAAERVDRARELYETAGYSQDNPLTLRYVYDSGSIHEKVALAIGAMWRDSLGVVVEFDKREWKYFLDTRDNRSEWQVMRFSWFGDYNDASTFLDIFASGNVQNLPRYSSAAYDELLRSASLQVDPTLRAEQLATAEKTLINDYPIVPLYFFVSKHMVKSDVAGFESNIMDRHPSKYLYRRE